MSGTEPTRERWLPVVGFEGRYEVSDQGRVRGLARQCAAGKSIRRSVPSRLMTPFGKKYLRVALASGGHRTRNYHVHTLVLEAFVGPRPAGYQACHNSGNAHDNRAANLRWGTASENVLDTIRHGNHRQLAKETCPRGHALAEPNLSATDLRRGQRDCMACAGARHWARVNGVTDGLIIAARADYRYDMIMRSAA